MKNRSIPLIALLAAAFLATAQNITQRIPVNQVDDRNLYGWHYHIGNDALIPSLTDMEQGGIWADDPTNPIGE